MAKKPTPKKEEKPAKNPEEDSVSKAFSDLKKRQEELNKEKNYSDILEYASKFSDIKSVEASPPSFPQNVKISAYETAAPYYGSEAEAQLEAAKKYAAMISVQKDSSVNIPPEYYQELMRKVAVQEFPGSAHYSETRQRIGVPNPVRLAVDRANLSDKELAINNYLASDEARQSFIKNLPKNYIDTIEHEAGHIPDSRVQLSAKGGDFNMIPDVGYMGKFDHLVTGLSKVQREHYSMTGKRFETPDEFKSFILDLARSPNQEEKISGFSEEAKRALRAQLINANILAPQLDAIKKWEEDKSLFKWPVPPPIRHGSMDFLDMSSKLIPGLVQTGTKNKSSA